MAMKCLAVALVLATRIASADPPPRYPNDFPLVSGFKPITKNIVWMSSEMCDVLLLEYPALTRDALEKQLRAKLAAAHWTVVRQKWAAKHSVELVARKKGRRDVPLILFAKAKAGSTLTVYRCEP